ncbi:MAG: hypothetical protein K9M13_01895, partial [Simkaniaceae bacterium]|nr:hypothetical protein [Simkaniaceae bacterium]
NHHCDVKSKGGCFVIEKKEPVKNIFVAHPGSDKRESISTTPLYYEKASLPPLKKEQEEFSVYKLQFHQGDEILAAIKQLSASSPKSDPLFTSSVQSMQWIKTTNSLVISGPKQTISKLVSLIKTLDTPQKQVFIEVLVIETDISKSHEFGLNWSVSSKYKNRLGFGTGDFNGANGSQFAKTMQTIGDAIHPSGLSQFPIGRGFDLGVIGDIITHNGMTFLSLGSLVSALQSDHETAVILNQKLIAQDNKCTKVFVGHNIPFAGSVVETVGPSQQTTSNIEYRNIGTSLNITPYIGENGMITLEIDEEITEASDRHMHMTKQMSGIETSKTNMVSRVHVPDAHFVVLTGMVRNKKKQETSGLPCLGGIPFISTLFSKDHKVEEKRNIIIFVRPYIIDTFSDYEALSDKEINQAKESKFVEEMIEDIILEGDGQDEHALNRDPSDELLLPNQEELEPLLEPSEVDPFLLDRE